MIALSVIAAVAGTSSARQLIRRLGGWNSAIAGGAAYLAVITVSMLILPSVNEVPADFSATTLWNFRIASLGTEAVLWMALGLVFGLLAERQLLPPSASAPLP
jgi:predicted cobalt transporter CbtA